MSLAGPSGGVSFLRAIEGTFLDTVIVPAGVYVGPANALILRTLDSRINLADWDGFARHLIAAEGYLTAGVQVSAAILRRVDGGAWASPTDVGFNIPGPPFTLQQSANVNSAFDFGGLPDGVAHTRDMAMGVWALNAASAGVIRNIRIRGILIDDVQGAYP